MDSLPGPTLSANAATFAHLSDLHLPHEVTLAGMRRCSKRQLSVWSWRRRKHVQRPEILAALRDDVQRHHPGHVVVTGDITNFSLPDEFSAAATWLASLGPRERVHVVPGNHDALVPVPHYEGLAKWAPWMNGAMDWPYVSRHGSLSFIGLRSAVPTAPLLAAGHIGAEQLARLESALQEEGKAGRMRIVLLHHPVTDAAVRWRKALRDRHALRAVLNRAGAELVLHGHARNARLDAVTGPRGPIPVMCVPSSSALPNPHDEAARWHLVTLPATGGSGWAHVLVRQWSLAAGNFVDAASYRLQLPDVE